MEFKVEVCMTPHYHDNPSKPYFWVILGDNANHGSGWAATPEEAWAEASAYYKDIYGEKDVVRSQSKGIGVNRMILSG